MNALKIWIENAWWSWGNCGKEGKNFEERI